MCGHCFRCFYFDTNCIYLARFPAFGVFFFCPHDWIFCILQGYLLSVNIGNAFVRASTDSMEGMIFHVFFWWIFCWGDWNGGKVSQPQPSRKPTGFPVQGAGPKEWIQNFWGQAWHHTSIFVDPSLRILRMSFGVSGCFEARFGVSCQVWCFNIVGDALEVQDQTKNLRGGFKYFLFSPLLGEMIQFDEHIFQMGWFNHQLGTVFRMIHGKDSRSYQPGQFVWSTWTSCKIYESMLPRCAECMDFLPTMKG